MPATATDRLAGLTTSVAVKAPCRVTTTAAITLSGLQTIDGVALAARDRVLVKDQASEAENGIWVAQSGTWVRSLDFDGSRDVVSGTKVDIRAGTTWANSTWSVVADDPVYIGTTAITFVQSDAAVFEAADRAEAASSSSAAREIPSVAFSWVPIDLFAVYGTQRISISEDPVNYAYRTEENDGPYDVVYVAETGDNTIGDGSASNPWRQPSKAFTSNHPVTGERATRCDAFPGEYEPWSLRADNNPTGTAQLRHFNALGPVTIRMAYDDIASDARASAIVYVEGGNVLEEGDEVVIASTALVFTATPSDPTDIDLGVGLGRSDWAARLASCINLNSATLGVTATAFFGSDPTTGVGVNIIAVDPGEGGNAITLTASSNNNILTPTSATLEGGAVGWTLVGDGVWSFNLTASNPVPRGVVDHEFRDPVTGYELPLTWYGNCRRIEFSGNPAPADYIEVTSGIGTRRVTFVASGASGITQCDIGDTLLETLTSLQDIVNGSAVLFGLNLIIEDSDTALYMQRLGSASTILMTKSGATMTLGSQTAGADELADLVLYNNATVPEAVLVPGGWAWDDATDTLYVKNRGLDIQVYKENLELITGDGNARCFIWGARFAVSGDVQWRGTYNYFQPYVPDQVTYPAREYYSIRNVGRPTCFLTPMDTGLVEQNGTQAIMRGMNGFLASIDTFHLGTSTNAPKTLLIECGSQLCGDPYTFPLLEFPNRNGVSAHGSEATTAVWGGLFQRSRGPELTSQGPQWYVGVDAGQSRGTGNNYGLVTIDSSSVVYADTCNIIDCETDVAVSGDGVINAFRLSYRTSDGVITDWTPPVA